MVSGKTVVITGGTRGIGRAIAEKFFSTGNKVIVLYNSSDQEAEKMKERGFYVLKCDVSKRDQVIDAAKKVSEITKTVDILVNNAGICI